jgi:hypothetical protein
VPARSAAPKTRKISITVDEEVLRGVVLAAKRAKRSLSAHVTEALARDLRRSRLRELIEEYEAEHGEISDAELAVLRAECRA